MGPDIAPLAGWLVMYGVQSTLAGWLLTYAVHSTLALGAAWAVGRLGWVRCPAARETLWKTAIVAGVLTSTGQVFVAPTLGRAPTFWRAVPADVERGLHEITARPDFGPANWTQSGDDQGVERYVVARVGSASTAVLASNSTRCRVELREALASEELKAAREVCGGGLLEKAWIPWVIVLFWGGGGILGLLRLGWNHRILARMLSERRTIEGGPAPRILSDILRRGTPCTGVRLSVAEGLESPAVLGRREIALPPGLDRSLDEAELTAVLAHEVAHVLRGDPLWTRLARSLEAVFFFQPLNRIARREIHDAAEFLCDDWAVVTTGEPVTLARSLARVASGMTPGLPQPALAMARGSGSPLVERVERILLPGEGRVRSRWWLRAGLALSLLALPAFVPAIEMQQGVHITISTEAGELSEAALGVKGEEGVEIRVMRFLFKGDEGGRVD